MVGHVPAVRAVTHPERCSAEEGDELVGRRAPALVEAHLEVLLGAGLVGVHGDGAVVGPAVGRRA